MYLLKENQTNKKSNITLYLIGAFLCIVALILFSITLIADIRWYIDFPSILIPTIICLAIVFLSGKRDKKSIVHILKQSVMPVGFLVTLINAIAILGNLTDLTYLGPSLAVCIITLLYCNLAYLVLLILEQHLK